MQMWNFNLNQNSKFNQGLKQSCFEVQSYSNLKYRSNRRNRISFGRIVSFSILTIRIWEKSSQNFQILCLRSGPRSIIYHAPGSESEPIRWIWMHVSRTVFRQMVFWDWSPWTNQVENLANQRKADIQVMHDVCRMMSKGRRNSEFWFKFFFRLTSREISTDFRMLFSLR